MTTSFDKLTFHNHPYKAEIMQMWNDKKTNSDIYNWLKQEYPSYVLSIATLCKHHKNFKRNESAVGSVTLKKSIRKDSGESQLSKIEVLLWGTIKDCQKRKKDKTLSPKDWQYLDQQQQHAIDKIVKINERSGETRDISIILTELFRKIQLGENVDVEAVCKRDLSEEDKLKIVNEVDKKSV